MFGHIFNGEGGQNPQSKVVFEKKFVVLLLKKHDKKGTNCLRILGHSFLKASYIYNFLGHLKKDLRDAFQKSVS